MWEVLFSEKCESEVKSFIKNGVITEDDRRVISIWIKQVKKHGGYLHNRCLRTIQEIEPNKKSAIITNTGVYKFEILRGSYAIKRPKGSSFMGFGGAEITVIFEDEVIETNNLFHRKSTKEKRIFKIIKKKINAILVWTWGLTEEEIQEARNRMSKKWDQKWHQDICERIRVRKKAESNAKT